MSAWIRPSGGSRSLFGSDIRPAATSKADVELVRRSLSLALVNHESSSFYGLEIESVRAGDRGQVVAVVRRRELDRPLEAAEVSD